MTTQMSSFNKEVMKNLNAQRMSVCMIMVGRCNKHIIRA